MPDLTPQQRAAIASGGDVLVMAGAGTGKTTTLVGRILDRLLDPAHAASLDRFLVVTFTEAAAAELRNRLRISLEERMAAAPDDRWLAEQLATIDSASIATLHAFCLRLLREHFADLGLDPQFAVQEEMHTAVLRRQVLDDVLRRQYQGQDRDAPLIRSFLERHARDGEEAVKALILHVHDHARSLPDPESWFSDQRSAYASARPEAWTSRLPACISAWAQEWLAVARDVASWDPDNFAAHECFSALTEVSRAAQTAVEPRPPAPADPLPRQEIGAALQALIAAGDRSRFPKGKIGTWRKPLEKVFDEAAELHAFLVPVRAEGPDPIEEDWEWARADVLALLELVKQFTSAFADARRAAAVVDFADLEQFALRLLWDLRAGEPTSLARQWQDRFEWVFVDEYQDINGAQDRIITCLSRGGLAANRFFVGDVKQSIYRFRRAEPEIFQRYSQAWREGPGHSVVPLVENFRSHQRILDFINHVFAELMRHEVGGVAYDAEARLEFGAPEDRIALRSHPDGRVELLVHVPTTPAQETPAPDTDATNASDTDLDAEESQAAIVAGRLRQLHDEGCQVWDAAALESRPVAWRDMVVLHPSPRPIAERWARQFLLARVPFDARRGGFFSSLEITDLTNLIRLLDNPRQDLPLLAVLRSPLVGMGIDELAEVRLARRDGALWDALARLVQQPPMASDSEAGPARDSAISKAAWFRRHFDHWRRLAREGSLAWCLEVVLAETGYEAGLRAEPRADARLANLRRLLRLSREFDEFQRHGLFRFLQFLEAQADSDFELESAPSAATDSVRLMSVHQSKGLEFPIVVVAGLGRRFNLSDLHADWLVDDDFGLCPPVLPAGRRRRYPSVARWLAERRQRHASMGELIRLFYVACTRAADRLILAGTARESALEKWRPMNVNLSTRELTRATTPFAWLGPLLPRLTGREDWADHESGRGLWMDWRLFRSFPASPVRVGTQVNATEFDAGDGAALVDLRAKLSWRYPREAVTREAAKEAVTRLTRGWKAEEDTTTGAAARLEWPRDSSVGSATAVERGLVHHLVCERIELPRSSTREGLVDEVRRLEVGGWLTAAQAALVDLDGLWGFWGSEVGDRLRARAGEVHRELPFTMRLDERDVARLRGTSIQSEGFSGDFQVVQGVIDLALVMPREIWVVDFKTDNVTESEVDQRAGEYRFQVQTYAFALASIYQRPVTRCWLYFVGPRRLVEMALASA